MGTRARETRKLEKAGSRRPIRAAGSRSSGLPIECLRSGQEFHSLFTGGRRRMKTRADRPMWAVPKSGCWPQGPPASRQPHSSSVPLPASSVPARRRENSTASPCRDGHRRFKNGAGEEERASSRKARTEPRNVEMCRGSNSLQLWIRQLSGLSGVSGGHKVRFLIERSQVLLHPFLAGDARSRCIQRHMFGENMAYAVLLLMNGDTRYRSRGRPVPKRDTALVKDGRGRGRLSLMIGVGASAESGSINMTLRTMIKIQATVCAPCPHCCLCDVNLSLEIG